MEGILQAALRGVMFGFVVGFVVFLGIKLVKGLTTRKKDDSPTEEKS